MSKLISGAGLRQRRQALGLTQYECSIYLDCTDAYIGLVETEKRKASDLRDRYDSFLTYVGDGKSLHAFFDYEQQEQVATVRTSNTERWCACNEPGAIYSSENCGAK